MSPFKSIKEEILLDEVKDEIKMEISDDNFSDWVENKQHQKETPEYYTPNLWHGPKPEPCPKKEMFKWTEENILKKHTFLGRNKNKKNKKVLLITWQTKKIEIKQTIIRNTFLMQHFF